MKRMISMVVAALFIATASFAQDTGSISVPQNDQNVTDTLPTNTMKKDTAKTDTLKKKVPAKDQKGLEPEMDNMKKEKDAKKEKDIW